MITELSDNKVIQPAGWIYFDAECSFCVAVRRRWGRVFERRGFVWLPCQTPGAAARLGITDQQLSEAMWLQLANGRSCSGVDAWSHLLRRVGWLWLFGVVLALPGFRAIGLAAYRRIAKNRHCLGGECLITRNSFSEDQVPKGKPKCGPFGRDIRCGRSSASHGRHTAFLELP